uniref:Cytochrome c oxidase assembly protein COX19 n=1 Tax=Romanomermis culicivorax TaxID=13658 RepID=A0A915IN86_ROMCU
MYNKPIIKRTAPIKGSFPLDHENHCKEIMMKYMICLSKNDQLNEKCRSEAKNYFECRMEQNLMAKEDWQQLGYGDVPSKD